MKNAEQVLNLVIKRTNNAFQMALGLYHFLCLYQRGQNCKYNDLLSRLIDVYKPRLPELYLSSLLEYENKYACNIYIDLCIVENKFSEVTEIKSVLDYLNYIVMVESSNYICVPAKKGYNDTFYSWSNCDVCNRNLSGKRYNCQGLTKNNNIIEDIEVCLDCVYYMALGQLDNATMLNLED